MVFTIRGGVFPYANGKEYVSECECTNGTNASYILCNAITVHITLTCQ